MRKVKIRDIPSILSETYEQWLDDKSFKLSASLSFYSILSLVPLVVIITAVAGFFIGERTAIESILVQVREFIGPKGADLFEKLISYSFFEDSALLPSLISAFVVIAGSVIVLIDLKESLNIIWGIEVKPGKSFKLFFKNRLFAFPLVLAVGFLLVASFLSSTLLSLLSSFVDETFPVSIPLLQIGEIALSLFMLTILFAVLFKFLPDTKVSWSFVWQGAFFTSVLFNIGEFLIGLYLSNTYYGSVFGAAGSIVLLLIWIYYSSLIFFFGAEFTYVIRMKYSDEPVKSKKDFLTVKKTSEMIEEKQNRK